MRIGYVDKEESVLSNSCVIVMVLNHNNLIHTMYYASGFSPYNRDIKWDNPLTLVNNSIGEQSDGSYIRSNWTLSLSGASQFSSNTIKATVTKLDKLIRKILPDANYALLGIPVRISLDKEIVAEVCHE